MMINKNSSKHIYFDLREYSLDNNELNKKFQNRVFNLPTNLNI
jgi:hypothetical protein